MERRNFLRALVGGVATAAAVRSWPFRVYSFPSEIGAPQPLFDQLIAIGEMDFVRVPIRFVPAGAPYCFGCDGELGRGSGSIYRAVEVYSQEQMDQIIAQHGPNHSENWHQAMLDLKKDLPQKVSRSSQPFRVGVT